MKSDNSPTQTTEVRRETWCPDAPRYDRGECGWPACGCPDNGPTDEEVRRGRVLNKRRHGSPVRSIYIGRPSKWGNPFEIGRDGTRAEVIAKHRGWICDQPALLASLPELRGRDLVCWCAPAACHGDTLKELANV